MATPSAVIQKKVQQDNRLLAWAGDRVKACQDQGMYGKMIIHFEGGKITRTTTEVSEVPK